MTNIASCPKKSPVLANPRPIQSSLFRYFRLVPLVALTLLHLACSAEEDSFFWSEQGDAGMSFLSSESCQDDGAVRSCSAHLDLANGTLTCIEGEQTCSGGRWGACLKAEWTDVVVTRAAGHPVAVAATTATTACAGNRCDPSCKNFESEGGPYEPMVSASSAMPSSSIPDWSGLIPPWKKEPCQSGLDCQVNHRCFGVTTDSSCAHEKCAPGVALDAACDPCVERICAVSPGCCQDDENPATADWSPACVALVKSECDATCADPGAAVCSHGLCDVGSPLESTCDTCTQTVCGTPGFEFCCDTAGAWDASCVTAAKRLCSSAPPPVLGAGTHRCDYSLMGAGALALYGATVLGGNIGGGTGANAIKADGLVRSEVSHSIYSQGAMDLWSSTVSGDMRAGGAFDPSRCSNLVMGTCVGHAASVPKATVPTRSLSCGSTPVTVSASTVLPPGSYGAVTVSAGATLTLLPGPYSLSSLTLGTGAVLEMPDQGSVYMDICGAVGFGAGVTFQGVSGPADALRLIIYAGGNVTLGESAVVYAMITAPTSAALFSPGASAGAKTTLHGILHVSTAELMRHTLLNSTGLTGQACVDALIDVPAACPPLSGAPAPQGSGECIENADGYVDTACAGTDLALAFGCGREVVVCNHGLSDADPGAVVTFYDLSGAQLSTETPDPEFEIGTCTVSKPVKSGECITQTCPSALTDVDATLMVNVSNLTTPSECSRLDNWSLHDSNLDCPGTLNPMVESRRYEATCDDDRKPLWGLLSWTTETPGASEVEFRVRVSEEESDLDATAFTVVGVAQAATSTEVCQLGSVGPACAVDLTLELGLSTMTQPPFLELEMRLNPVGASAPRVIDWDVTYSCVVDQ